MGSGKKVTIGYKYFIGFHFVLAHGPVDAITRITVDEKTVWSGNSGHSLLYINNPKIFGGDKREGGVQGYFNFETGLPTQGKNDYLSAKIGADVPAYRGVTGVVLRQMYVGTNPYMKRWAFRLRRILTTTRGATQWYSAKAAIGSDMNPAHIIRECLTDKDWGMGYLDSDIDDTSFYAAADTLYNESFGMSILWDQQTTIEDFINEVLRHIDASLFVDKASTRFTLKLIRNDYNPATLQVFNEDNVIKIEDFSCTTFDELVNSVTVNYWNASTGNAGSLTVQDIAAVQLQGATLGTTVEYAGITNGTLASRVASRDLKALSSPITQCTVHCTRKMYNLTPGKPVKLTWPEYGIEELIMRVGTIDFGTQTDNTIKVTLVQDIFSLGTAIYAAPPDTEWVSPVNAPSQVTYRRSIETPYYALAMELGQYEIDTRLATDSSLGIVTSCGQAPTSDAMGAEVWADVGAGYREVARLEFCPVGVCSSIVSKTALTIPFSSQDALEYGSVEVGEYALLNDEFLEVTAVSTTSVSVKRGCLDSVPAEHSAGSRVYFMKNLNGIDQNEYNSGESVSTKLLTQTGIGVLDIGSAPATSVTMNRRAFRPYPPGAFSISGSYFPTQVLDVPITASWAHRHRTQQTGLSLVDFTEGSIGPEPGTTYELRLYNNDTSALLYSQSGLTGTSHSGFPTFSGNYNLRMELWSVRDTYASMQKHAHVFNYENIYRLTLEDGTGHIMTEDNNTLTTE